MTLITIFGQNPEYISPYNPKGEMILRTVRVLPAALGNINQNWMKYLEPTGTRFTM